MESALSLLDSARRGDENAFGELVEPYRSALRAHCYRMLGSLEDADDAVQESLLRAWRGLPRFEGRSSLRSWLYTIATNTSLRLIERRPKRVLPIDYGPPGDPHDGPAEPLTESVWIEPFPDEGVPYEERESVELAFIAALQHLPARQRAVLILRDVLNFSAAEVADALEATPEAVYSMLQRAHKAVEEKLPERSQQETLRSLGDAELRNLVESYVKAWEEGDVDTIVSMLADDARLTMPPRPSWFLGREAVRTFYEAWPLAEGRRWRLVPITANGQLAFAYYNWDEDAGRYLAHLLEVTTLAADGRVQEVTAFLEPEQFERFGLAMDLPA